MDITNETKMKALAKFLEIPIYDVLESRHDETVFEADGMEYLVLTDDEADEKARESILESVWAFRPEFLVVHSTLDAETISIIQRAKFEDANAPLIRTIEDVDHFVDDSVMADGRGHFLSHYDGQENEQGMTLQNGIRVTLFIYRMN